MEPSLKINESETIATSWTIDCCRSQAAPGPPGGRHSQDSNDLGQVEHQCVCPLGPDEIQGSGSCSARIVPILFNLNSFAFPDPREVLKGLRRERCSGIRSAWCWFRRPC